jgi:hypothetical protein
VVVLARDPPAVSEWLDLAAIIRTVAGLVANRK